jgi:hypothetical protein
MLRSALPDTRARLPLNKATGSHPTKTTEANHTLAHADTPTPPAAV